MSQDCTPKIPLWARGDCRLEPYIPTVLDPMAEVRAMLRELQEQLGEVRDMLACYKSPFALTPEERHEWSARLLREASR